MSNLSKYIDHTLLKPTATEMDFRKLCEEIYQNSFYSACVPPYYVAFVKELLEYSDAKVCTVIGFPLGYQTTEVKMAEAQKALHDGADELDMVMNISAFKSMAYETVKQEIKSLADLAHSQNALLKVIIETASGGIQTYEQAMAFIEAGVTRLGTSSGVAIVSGGVGYSGY